MTLPKDYDKEQVEKEIIDKARLNALENAFGRFITQTNTTSVQNVNIRQEATTKSMFSSNSFSFLTGKWISDVTAPQIEYFTYKKEDWVSASVTGKVKEMDISSIRMNPETVYDFLALAYSANEMGNTRKAIEYLEIYFQNEKSYFFEPHKLYLELMNDEDRQDEVIDFYKKRYENDPDIFNEFMYLLASKDEKAILKLSLSNPGFLPAKIITIKYYITKSLNFELGYEEGCQKYELMESYNDFLNSKYYNDSKYFLSKNNAKNLFTDNDKQIVKAWSIQRSYTIKSLISEGQKTNKTKEDILQQCIEMFSAMQLGCSDESITLLFNKLYEK